MRRSCRLLGILLSFAGLPAAVNAAEPFQSVACSSALFSPNYADEIGALQGGKWDHFPITIWIDPASVHNQREMDGLRAGLNSWSEGTGGVLGVSFIDSQADAQVEVKLVDSLPGDGSGRPGLGLTTLRIDAGVTTHALVQVVRTSPQILRAIGSSATPEQVTVTMTQMVAAHEMGHVLMGTPNRHPSDPSAVLKSNNLSVTVPSAIDLNTAQTKYCYLFQGTAAHHTTAPAPLPGLPVRSAPTPVSPRPTTGQASASTKPPAREANDHSILGEWRQTEADGITQWTFLANRTFTLFARSTDGARTFSMHGTWIQSGDSLMMTPSDQPMATFVLEFISPRRINILFPDHKSHVWERIGEPPASNVR